MQLVDYLNGMWYMICLPSLLCGLAISVEDIRSRRIPRAWIATGCTAQIIVNLMFGLFAVVFWWLAIGVVGLLWLVLWTRFDPQKHTAYAGKTPFAPALVAAGAIGIAIGVLF